MTVNWGPLGGGGMDLERQEERLRRVGIRALPAETVGAILGRLLQHNVAQVVATDVDWNVFKPIYEAQRMRPLLEHVGGQRVAGPVAVRDGCVRGYWRRQVRRGRRWSLPICWSRQRRF